MKFKKAAIISWTELNNFHFTIFTLYFNEPCILYLLVLS